MLMEKTATGKFDEVLKRLTDAIEAGGFGILAIHDFKETLESKGIPFGPRCTVFEVCNPPFAARVLGRDIAISAMLPCRLALYEKDGQPVIALASPVRTIRELTDDTELHEIAGEVEEKLQRIVEAAV